MFRSARIKLTAWYLLIIMLVSISFSVVVYKVLTSELDRVERVQRLRSEFNLAPRLPEISTPSLRDGLTRPFRLDPDLIEETKRRLAIALALVNLAILGASALAGYFLAGRTLRPLAEMVDEQNRFISDASHELRTPLTSLKTEIEVNLRSNKLNLNEAKDLLKSNLEEVNNLQILSDGLIKLTQYRQKNNGLTFAQISLKETAEEAVKKVSTLAKNKSITIIDKVADQTIEGNRPALTEMFVIFLDNAIKYSPDLSKIKLSSERTDGSILIHIADEGFGIEGKDIPHLFDRFFRADKSRNKTEAAGYGLGLSIAKQIIERHNGSVNVKSKLGKGTTFTIRLPRHLNVL